MNTRNGLLYFFSHIKRSALSYKTFGDKNKMNSNLKKSLLASVVASGTLLAGCTTTDSQLQSRVDDLNKREAALELREAQAGKGALASAAAGGDLLPPNAAPGECYARVWNDAEYEVVSNRVLKSEASSKITTTPAVYKTVSEKVLVSAASSTIKTTPAVYKTVKETIKVGENQIVWRTTLNKKSPQASDALLAQAKKFGINLEQAKVGQCFHEHSIPAKYKTVSEKVLKSAASEVVSVSPAQYKMVEKRLLVKEASTKIVPVAAVYKTVSEKVVDKPAHTIWKKGTGPIQRINAATGEIMCLVDVPATYKTVSRRVLATPASTKVVDIPAEYKTIKVRELVVDAKETRKAIPATYDSFTKRVLDTAATVTWHPVSNTDHPASTRTGNQICLTETPATFKTIAKKVVATPAKSQTIAIPAKYKTVEVTKLVTPAAEKTTVIPATYKEVETRKLVKDGHMVWRSILCGISQIQSALIEKGYSVGAAGADGVIGSETIQAFNAFQKKNGLPVDKYLNIQTVKALGVSPR